MDGQGSGSGRGQTTTVGEGDYNEEFGKGGVSDESETEEVRRAMAEAIWEMEREDEEAMQMSVWRNKQSMQRKHGKGQSPR